VVGKWERGQGGEERKEGSVVGRFDQRTTDVDQVIDDDARPTQRFTPD
jgi:hypothetical protein